MGTADKKKQNQGLPLPYAPILRLFGLTHQLKAYLMSSQPPSLTVYYWSL